MGCGCSGLWEPPFWQESREQQSCIHALHLLKSLLLQSLPYLLGSHRGQFHLLWPTRLYSCSTGARPSCAGRLQWLHAMPQHDFWAYRPHLLRSVCLVPHGSVSGIPGSCLGSCGLSGVHHGVSGVWGPCGVLWHLGSLSYGVSGVTGSLSVCVYIGYV